jgi:hypothetical protein
MRHAKEEEGCSPSVECHMASWLLHSASGTCRLKETQGARQTGCPDALQHRKAARRAANLGEPRERVCVCEVRGSEQAGVQGSRTQQGATHCRPCGLVRVARRMPCPGT